jgi:hypothetical protein
MANITKPLGLSNIWANGGTKIDPGTSKVNIGWVVQLPPYEYQNWIDNRQDRAIAHISQHGIPEWDSATEYQGLLSYTQGSNGIIYKCLQTNTNKDPANTLNNLFWAVAFEEYGSVAVVSAALSAHITNYQTLSGVANLVAARNNLSVYSKSESDTRFAGLNGSSAQVFAVAVATQPEHAVRLGQVSSLLTQATESTLGVVKLATTGATETGTDDLTAITPLKGNAVYLKKSGNLSGMANYATARSNLGLGTAATQNVGAFAQTANNLSDLLSASAARSNLGLTSTATQPENYFLRAAQNLADVSNPGFARTNLGLTSTAVTPLSSILLKSDNLAGLTDVVLSRSNLGLGSASVSSTGDFLQTLSNLSDLPNKQTARNNLGLGNGATHNFNSVVANPGYMIMPNGLVFQWGNNYVPAESLIVTLPLAMTEIYSLNATAHATTNAADGVEVVMISGSRIQLVCYAAIGQYSGRASWFVVGKL